MCSGGGNVVKSRMIDDDAVTAMMVVGAISIASLVVLGANAKDIVLMAVGGILALARGKGDKKSGLPAQGN